MTALFSSIRVVAVVVAAIFTSGFTSPSTSKSVDKTKTDQPAITVQLKYMGINNEYSVFELAFCNTQETRFTVKIMDENDTVFLTDYVKGVSFIKKYLLNTDDLAKVSLHFEVTNKKTGEKVTYRVDRKISVVENMVISKVK